MAERPCKDDPILIVGAGIFGLSTALHLARRGYRHVTVFDRQDYDTGLYSYQKGCDAASAGMDHGLMITRIGFSPICRFEQDHPLSLRHSDGIPGAFI